MNSVVKEMKEYFGASQLKNEDSIEHYGVGHLQGGHSGRYPWGSGDKNFQRSTNFLDKIQKLKSKGWKENAENIKKEFGMSMNEYRREKSLSDDYVRMVKISAVSKMANEQKMNPTEIAKKVGLNESTVRGWLKQGIDEKYNLTRNTADFLKKQIKEKKMIDVGEGVEHDLNISRDKLDTALYMLEKEGYHLYKGRMAQPTNKNQTTTQLVLASPDTEHKEIYDYEKVKSIKDYISQDFGKNFDKKFTYPESLDSKRLKIRYGEDGGLEKDGTIELRRGVQDLDLGGSKYAQVRILVDGTHYIKGMAFYSDDMPAGYDVVFNTNKTKDKHPGKLDVLKPIKDDPENPFGSLIKDADQGGQYWYVDKKTGKRKLGLINKRSDEGDWSEWSNGLPSQFLSKQGQDLAKKQLNLAKVDKLAEFDEIMSLQNNTIKKYYLQEFANNCDRAAVDLKAASLPGQRYHVIVPINTLKDNEVYAPQYKPGTKLALIRYPHGGIFEIPVLTVTDKNALGDKIIGRQSIDAIGITKKNANKLSGADFDGDTVMVIPTDDRKGRIKIQRSKGLPGLEDFDPSKYEYSKKVTKTDKNGKQVIDYYIDSEGNKFQPMRCTNKEMGVISNLITDMTLKGASDDKLERAVKQSMIVIDAEKHGYNYKRSEIDNDIASLKKEYQIKEIDDDGNITYGGAGTIVSRAKGEKRVTKTKGQGYANVEFNKNGKRNDYYDPTRPEGALVYRTADDKDRFYAKGTYDKKAGTRTYVTEDGKKITYKMNDKEAVKKYTPVLHKNKDTGEVYYTSKDGKIVYKTEERKNKTTRMADTDDARTLMSTNPHPIERLYADYANSMKTLANKARLEILATPNHKYNPEAKKVYKDVVLNLVSRINQAEQNKPKERAAIRLTLSELKRRKESNPNIKGDEEAKLKQRLLTKYREQVQTVNRRNRNLTLSDKEWEAIQAGAVTDNQLIKILKNSDPAKLRERAMPSASRQLSSAQVSRIKALADSNYSLNQIADKMGISVTTVNKYLKGEK